MYLRVAVPQTRGYTMHGQGDVRVHATQDQRPALAAEQPAEVLGVKVEDSHVLRGVAERCRGVGRDDLDLAVVAPVAHLRCHGYGKDLPTSRADVITRDQRE